MLISFITPAQDVTLQISLLNTKQESVQNATVILYQLPDTVLKYKKTVTGNAILKIQVNTSYILQVTAVGMLEETRRINVSDSSQAITIELQNKISSLETVTVVAKRPLIKQDDDKTIVDAEVLANSSTNAYEVLEKTPGAILDSDGNVY